MDDEHVQFRNDCRDKHNEVRRIHGAGELELAKFVRVFSLFSFHDILLLQYLR
jgi:hypothetical protein